MNIDIGYIYHSLYLTFLKWWIVFMFQGLVLVVLFLPNNYNHTYDVLLLLYGIHYYSFGYCVYSSFTKICEGYAGILCACG